jgi:hypothetical protein
LKQHTTPRLAENLRDAEALEQGTTLQLAEKVHRVYAMSQGTTSVVPQEKDKKGLALAPEGCSLAIRNSAHDL